MISTNTVASAIPVLVGQLDSETLSSTGQVAQGLSVLDWAVVASYFIGTLFLGWYFGRKTKSVKEFFFGSGQMPPFLIGVSLFASLLSAITYLSLPGEAIGKGPMQLTKILGFPIAYAVVGYVLLPVFMSQRVTSAYELLDVRLGRSVRLLAAATFIVMRLTWMSLVVFAGAKAITLMFGMSPEWTQTIVLAMGLVTVTSSSAGGLRAVVITDLLQSTFLYGGALAILASVTWDFGGLGWIPTTWQSHWDLQPVVSLDPSVRITVLGSIVSVATLLICTSGSDQTSVQRFMATRDAESARRAFAVQLICAALISITLVLVGLALLAYYQKHPTELRPGVSLTEHADNVFPCFISQHLPPGVAGLVIAGMLAAALSALDSGVNSITAVVMTDFLAPARLLPESERKRVRVARLINFGIGIAIVTGSALMKGVPGNLMSVTAKTSTLLAPNLFCLFAFALFFPSARPIGVWCGAIAGVTTAVLVAFSGAIFGKSPTTNEDPVSFQWIAPATIVVDLAVGLAVSWIASSRRQTFDIGPIGRSGDLPTE